VLELRDVYRSLAAVGQCGPRRRVRAGTRIDIGVSGNRRLQTSYLRAARRCCQRRRSPTPLGRVLREHAPQEGVDRIVFSCSPVGRQAARAAGRRRLRADGFAVPARQRSDGRSGTSIPVC
jgi:hypothetical protein